MLNSSWESADADGVACVDQVGVLDVGVQGHQLCDGGAVSCSDGAEGVACFDGVVVIAVVSAASDVFQFGIDDLVFHNIQSPLSLKCCVLVYISLYV